MRLARRAAYSVIRKLPMIARQVLLDHELLDCRARVTRKFVREFGSVVQGGPFAGMEILAEYSWGDGHLLPKLLGSYESELHEWISQVPDRGYHTIIDVGCAEGYYTVGLARASPATIRLIGCDVSPRACRICKQNAVRNGVSDRVEVIGRCSPESMTRILSDGGRSLLLLDCEGAEIDVLRPELIPLLRSADILVECHDFFDRRLTDTLWERFSPTHFIERVEERERDPGQFPFLKNFSSLERALAVCEFRPEPMHWLFCTSKHFISE